MKEKRKEKTYTEDDIMEIMCLFFETRSYTEVSKELDVPVATVHNIVERNINEDKYKKIRKEKEEQFIDKANHLIFKSMYKMNKELEEQEHIPINQLTTAIGTLYDKKMMAQTGILGNDTPSVQINIVDNSNLEQTLYDEEEE